MITEIDGETICILHRLVDVRFIMRSLMEKPMLDFKHNAHVRKLDLAIDPVINSV